MREAHYSIKDLEKLSGIKAHTLRIWEKRYGILQPERTTTNIRLYSDRDLKKILNIALLNKQGFKISILSRLDERDLNEKVLTLTQNEPTNEFQLDNLLSAMVEFDENKFDKIIGKAIINYGFEETLSRVIFPMFEKIGMLWQANAINPAQEHFISNLIRQKLLVAIDGLINNYTPYSKSFFLFLPEGEWHEVSLLVYAYFIKKAGHKLIYFGQSLPLGSLKEASNLFGPDCLLTILTCSLHEMGTDEYIDQLSVSFPDMRIFISGSQVKFSPSALPANVRLISSLAEFKNQLAAFGQN